MKIILCWIGLHAWIYDGLERRCKLCPKHQRFQRDPRVPFIFGTEEDLHDLEMDCLQCGAGTWENV